MPASIKASSENHSGDVNKDSETARFAFHIPSESDSTISRNRYSPFPGTLIHMPRIPHVNLDVQVEGLSPTRRLAQTALWEIISHNPTCGPLRPRQRFGIPLLCGVSQVLLKRTVPGNAHPLDTRVSLTRWRWCIRPRSSARHRPYPSPCCGRAERARHQRRAGPCGGEVAERRAVPGCSAASLSDRFLISTPEM